MGRWTDSPAFQKGKEWMRVAELPGEKWMIGASRTASHLYPGETVVDSNSRMAFLRGAVEYHVEELRYHLVRAIERTDIVVRGSNDSTDREGEGNSSNGQREGLLTDASKDATH